MGTTDMKLVEAARNLRAAIQQYEQRKPNDDLPFLTVCKAFEVLVEYTWRHLQREVEEQGLLAPSPREAFRQAATIGSIEKPQRWMEILTARNDSVHDYFGIPEEKYLKLARELLKLGATLFTRGK